MGKDTLLAPPLFNKEIGKYEFLRENQGVVSWYFDRDSTKPKSYVTSHRNKNEFIYQGSFTQCVTALFYQQLKFSEHTESMWQFSKGSKHLLISRYKDSIIAQVDWPPDTTIIDPGKIVVELDDADYVYISFLDKKSKEVFLSENRDLEFEI